MSSSTISFEERFASTQKAPVAKAALLGLGLAVFANFSAAWAHGDEEHSAPAQAALTEAELSVVDALNHYAASVQAKDMDAIEKYVVTDDSFSSIEGTFVDQGWASYKDHLGPEMAMFQDPTYSFSDIKPRVMGDMAYARMGYNMSLTILSDQFEGGKHFIETKGMATMVLANDDGAWKIQHMHTVAERARDEAATEENPH